jgi:hypothetical protein
LLPNERVRRGGFSLAVGGPFQWVTGWVGPERLAVLLPMVTWLPLLAIAMLDWSRSGRLPRAFLDYALHARLLVGIPLLVLAERSLHLRTTRCLDRFVDGGWAEEGEDGVASCTARANHALAATAPELVTLGLALIGSQVVIWGLGESLGVARGRPAGDANGWSLFIAWYGVVALPLYQFLLYRSLWRWLVWARLLWGLSRLRVRPIASHPDRHGGLGFLAEPSVAFAVVVGAMAAVQSAVWADRITFRHVELTSLRWEMVLFLALEVALTVGPLLFFAPRLWRARFEAIRDYDRLATDYTRLFQARWIDRRDTDGLLGSQDIQALADLGTAYQVVGGMRPVPFGRRTLVIVVAAVVLPIVPLALMTVPLVELVRKLGAVVLGGLPG